MFLIAKYGFKLAIYMCARSKLKVGAQIPTRNARKKFFCASSPFEGALGTRGWAQSCAGIGLLFVPMITTTSGNRQHTGIVQQLGIYFRYFAIINENYFPLYQ